MSAASLAPDPKALESAPHHHPSGDLLQAAKAYRHALKHDPTIAAAHYGLGNALAQQDNFAAALISFQFAARLKPTIPEFHFAIAFAHSKLGEHTRAIAAYRRAITLRPSFASAWLNLGVELIADGRPNLAVLCYREALAASAQNPNTRISAHLNIGHLARSRHYFPVACEHYTLALTLAPPNHLRHAEVQIAFTYLHLEQKQFPEAWQSLQAAESAVSDPPNPEIPNVRGILLLAEDVAVAHSEISSEREGTGFSPYRKQTQFPWAFAPEVQPPLDRSSKISYGEKVHQAIAAFAQAEALGHQTAASNRGNALLRLGRYEEAFAAQHAAVARDPHHPGVRYNLALTQLRLGDFTHGWPNYEIRWSFREVHPNPRPFHQPRWQGETLPQNSTLLIHSEQGLGDTLQFVRYLALVAQRLRSPATNPGAPHLDFEMWDSQTTANSSQARIILEVQPPLTRLLTAHFGAIPTLVVQVVAHGDPLPHFTHHIPLMSLPAVFQTTPETVPNQIPYLHSDPELTTARAGEFSISRPAIGIAWAGNPKYRADHERSTRLETFLPFLEIPSIQWISLQKGESACQIAQLPPHISLYDGCSSDRDFADTAALVANLDLVITTDTAVAHLAGALGKPLWLLLPWQSDWRWMQQTPTTPWYPTARLFRQSSPNNWPELIHRVACELRAVFKAGEYSANTPPRMATGSSL